MEINPEETTAMKENNTTPTAKPAIKPGFTPSNIHGSSIRASAFIGGLLAALGVLVYTTLADSPPVLTIAPLGSNQFSITITNATSPTNYTLFWRPSLNDPNYDWQVLGFGGVGETNFTVDAGSWPIGFVKVLLGVDQDGDSVPEWMDAQPLNPSVGALTVTIDSPLNGSTLN